MIGSSKLNEIINNTKSSSDERGINFEEGVSTFTSVTPKFVRSTTEDTKMKSIIAIYKDKFFLHPGLPPLVR